MSKDIEERMLAHELAWLEIEKKVKEREQVADYVRLGHEITRMSTENMRELANIQADCPHERRTARDASLFGRSNYVFCSLCRKVLEGVDAD